MNVPPPTINPRLARLLRERGLRKRRDHKRWVRFLWRAVILLAAVLVAEGLWASYTSPRFWVYRIKVRGLDSLTEGEVLRFADVPPQTSYFHAPCAEIARNIEHGDPRVASAIVRRGAIGVLLVDVQEREPLCRVGDAEPPLFLDKTHFLFPRPTPPRHPVPTITGIPTPKDKVPYRVLNSAQARDAVACLQVLPHTSVKGIPISVDHGEVADDGSMNLYLQEGTQIIVGKSEYLREKMYLLQKVVDHLKDSGTPLDQVELIDTSTVSPVNLNTTTDENTRFSAVYKLKTP